MSSSTKKTPTKGSKILVTGASGFVATHCVAEILKEGFEVVGSVRSASKGEYLKKLYAGKKFSFVVVEDVGTPGAFDEAVKDVEGVLHTASPFHLKATDPEELIRPAVDGTTSVLKSIAAHGNSVKRTVVTSSVAAIIEPAEAPKTFTEADWNNVSIANCERLGKDASPVDIYFASKALAEKAAWQVAKDEDLSLATVCPPYVFGPILQDVSSPDGINTSVSAFWAVASGGTAAADLPGPQGNWVDVRDVARAHFLALTTPEADGERFISSSGPFCTQDFTDALLKVDPALPNIPKGQAGAAAKANDPANAVVHSGDKAAKVLGLTYTSMEQSVADMYASIRAKGF